MKTLILISLFAALAAFSQTTNCGTSIFVSDWPDPFNGATNFMQGSYCNLVGGVRYRVDHGYDVGEIGWGPGLTWNSDVDIDIYWFDEQGAIFNNHAPGTGKINIYKSVSSAYPGEYFILRNLDAPPPLLLSNGIVPLPKPALARQASKSTAPPLPALPRPRYKAIPKGAEMLMRKSISRKANVRHIDWNAIMKLPLQPIPKKPK